MRTTARRASDILSGLLPASRGAGPLLQRDYWAVIDRARAGPQQVMAVVASRFAEFAPAELCLFSCAGRPPGELLEPGDELQVRIRGAGTFGVRVLDRDANSLTLATLPGHPEAGRITFGAYRNARGDVLFHIRSRARSGSRLHYAGFLAMGEAMQTNTWTEFVERVALTVGDGVLGSIHAETTRMRGEPPEAETAPTYVAQGQ